MMEIDFNKHNSKLIERYTCGIYAIKNNLNGKMYIGSSTNIRSRYESHYYGLNSGNGVNKLLQKDFNEIGCNNFSFLIIETCEDNHSTLRFLEQKYIQEYGYYNKCMVDGRKIYCYDKQGNFIKEYNTIKEAARTLGALPDNLRASCDGRKKSCCGFQWSYEKVDNIGKYKKKEYEIKGCKPVFQLDYYGQKIIASYDSIREASRATGILRQSISDCLRKNPKRKHAGGFTWTRKEQKNKSL